MKKVRIISNVDKFYVEEQVNTWIEGGLYEVISTHYSNGLYVVYIQEVV